MIDLNVTNLLHDVRRVTRQADLSPEQETLGWALAERLGLIDGIGGVEWRHRLESRGVSPAAAALLLNAGWKAATVEAMDREHASWNARESEE